MDSENRGGYCPRLIEVALPIREISAESVRDKNLHQSHIRNLHVWWARRPLAASRAVVFASIVPDPDDPRCPGAFSGAVERLLRTDISKELKHYTRGHTHHEDEDPYRPYEGMSDTLRNRLLMFIAKWSPESLAFEEGKRKAAPAPKELLDDRSLVKWETFDRGNLQGRAVLKTAQEILKAACDGYAPSVLDPFAGGGAIPLEAGRLGCQPIANDYNPVAYLILRATCEFPQKYGKPGKRKVVRQDLGQEVEREEPVPNVLVHDVEKWARWILKRARDRIGHLYPASEDGRPVVGYLWARTAPCSNPACRGELPLLRSLLVCNKKGKRVALTMNVDKAHKMLQFGIAEGDGITATDGTMQNRGNTLCPYCGQVTPVADLRTAGLQGRLGERMVAVIVEDRGGKRYRQVEESDLKAFEKAALIPVERPSELILPEVNADDAEDDVSNSTGIRVHLYGMKTWGSLFNPRQLVAMQTFEDCLHEALTAISREIEEEEYRKAVGIYLGLWLSRTAAFCSSACIWASTSEIIKNPFGRQAIPMNWDYPEGNPLGSSSGSAEVQLKYLTDVIRREQAGSVAQRAATVSCRDAAVPSEDRTSEDAVITDPPYFDAISYADL